MGETNPGIGNGAVVALKDPTIKPPNLIRYLAPLLTTVPMVLGITVLLGWYTQNRVLIQIHPAFVPMQYNTALGFVMVGVALWALTRSYLRLAMLLGLLTLSIGGLTLGEYIFSIDLKIDQLFMKHYIQVKTSHLGRMAPNTALCFSLAGVTILISSLYRTRSNTSTLSVIFGVTIFSLGLVALAGYFIDLESAYGWKHFTRMAIHTSVGFIAIGLGFIALSWIREENMINRFLLYFIFISALPGLVFWLFYLSDIKFHEHLFESQETAHVNLQSKAIASHFQNVESDLAILSELHELRQLAAGQEDYSSKELEDDFLSISLRKGIYDQIRFINKTGQEVLRVNYNNGKPILLPKDRLKNKASRYYFKKTMNLNKEKVYVSPLDLNIEEGEVEKPFKPVIRFGTPIFNAQDEKQGVLILNFTAQFIIESFKNPGQDSLGQNHLLNSDGYWLSSPNPEDEWGFMLEERKNKAFSNTFSGGWTTILEEETGQFSTHKGLFTFTTLYPIMETQKLKSVLDKSQRVSVSRAKVYFWKIVSFVPQETLYQALRKRSKHIKNNLLMIYTFLVFLIGTGTFLFLKTGEQERKAKDALKMSEAKTRTIVTSIGEGIISTVATPDLTIDFVNQETCNIFGYLEEELVGQNLTILISEKYQADHIAGIKRYLCEGNPKILGKRVELEGLRKDGSSFPLELKVEEAKGKGGNSFFTAAIRDITERKRAEENKEKLIEELKESLDNVKSLSGLLPICANCKDIRNDNGYYEQIESYIRDHSEAEFSHSICPKCAKKLYPEFYDENENTGKQ